MLTIFINTFIAKKFFSDCAAKELEWVQHWFESTCDKKFTVPAC